MPNISKSVEALPGTFQALKSIQPQTSHSRVCAQESDGTTVTRTLQVGSATTAVTGRLAGAVSTEPLAQGLLQASTHRGALDPRPKDSAGLPSKPGGLLAVNENPNL